MNAAEILANTLGLTNTDIKDFASFMSDDTAALFLSQTRTARAARTATAPAVTASDAIQDRIRTAYATITRGEMGRWVSLTDIRPHLAGWSRADQDAALRQMERRPDVNLVPESNQKTLRPADRAAAINIGDQDKHLIWIAG